MSLPFSAAIEENIIGMVLFDPQAAAHAVGQVSADDFYTEGPKEAWRAISWLLDEKKLPDILAVHERMVATSTSWAAPAEALMAWETSAASAVMLPDRIIELKSLASRRNLMRVLSEQLDAAKDMRRPIMEIIGGAEAAIIGACDSAAPLDELKPMRDIMRDSQAEWAEAAKVGHIGLMSNIPAIDSIIRGYRPGTLNVIAARPGVGKSFLTMQIARLCGKNVACYSLEMMNIEQAERVMFAEVPGLSAEGLRNLNVLQALGDNYFTGLKRAAELPIWICDRSGITAPQILSQCRKLKKKNGLELIIVDYLQLVKSHEKNHNRAAEVGSVSKFLKYMGNELGVPVIAVASLSRECEKREDKRPIKSDLRESGEIESDAHSITCLYRHSDYDKEFKSDASLANVTEIIHIKNRGGRTGTSLALFDGARSTFYPMDDQECRRYFATLKSGTTEKDGWSK